MTKYILIGSIEGICSNQELIHSSDSLSEVTRVKDLLDDLESGELLETENMPKNKLILEELDELGVNIFVELNICGSNIEDERDSLHIPDVSQLQIYEVKSVAEKPTNDSLKFEDIVKCCKHTKLKHSWFATMLTSDGCIVCTNCNKKHKKIDGVWVLVGD